MKTQILSNKVTVYAVFCKVIGHYGLDNRLDNALLKEIGNSVKAKFTKHFRRMKYKKIHSRFNFLYHTELIDGQEKTVRYYPANFEAKLENVILSKLNVPKFVMVSERVQILSDLKQFNYQVLDIKYLCAKVASLGLKAEHSKNEKMYHYQYIKQIDQAITDYFNN